MQGIADYEVPILPTGLLFSLDAFCEYLAMSIRRSGLCTLESQDIMMLVVPCTRALRRFGMQKRGRDDEADDGKPLKDLSASDPQNTTLDGTTFIMPVRAALYAGTSTEA